MNIQKLAAAASALLDAHLSLLFAEEDGLAQSTRALAEQVISATRRSIECALAAPADALQRHAQLTAAIELDGVESPLAVQAALRFAEAAASDVRCVA